MTEAEDPKRPDRREIEAPYWRNVVIGFVSIVLVVVGGMASGMYLMSLPPDSGAAIAEAEVEGPQIVDGIDVESGLVVDAHWDVVKNNCTGCHSGKLITQNRMSREAWLSTIRWMQETQNLSDLGGNEVLILDYLEKNYAPKKSGRRPRLENVEWYELD